MSGNSSRGPEFDSSPVLYFRGGILKKSADENKSMINYPACNELNPFQPNCYELTPFSAKLFCPKCFKCLLQIFKCNPDYPFIMIMEAITMNADQTDPKGAILSRSFAIFDTQEHI